MAHFAGVVTALVEDVLCEEYTTRMFFGAATLTFVYSHRLGRVLVRHVFKSAPTRSDARVGK